MTAVLALGAGFVVHHPDRGISDDARELQRRLAEALGFRETIAIGDLKRDLLLALNQAVDAARAADPAECDAVPVDPRTYEYARDFILMLPTTAPHPEITIDSDGEICLEWDRGPRRIFSVSIGPDGTLSYAGLYGRNTNHGSEQFGEAIPAALATNIQRVASET